MFRCIQKVSVSVLIVLSVFVMSPASAQNTDSILEQQIEIDYQDNENESMIWVYDEELEKNDEGRNVTKGVREIPRDRESRINSEGQEKGLKKNGSSQEQTDKGDDTKERDSSNDVTDKQGQALKKTESDWESSSGDGENVNFSGQEGTVNQDDNTITIRQEGVDAASDDSLKSEMGQDDGQNSDSDMWERKNDAKISENDNGEINRERKNDLKAPSVLEKIRTKQGERYLDADGTSQWSRENDKSGDSLEIDNDKNQDGEPMHYKPESLKRREDIKTKRKLMKGKYKKPKAHLEFQKPPHLNRD